MHLIRKRVLEILKERGEATVAELAEALEMAPVSVRHHLDILQGDGLICVDRHERKGSVGRPQQVYVLTQAADAYFPNNFAGLAASLVDQIKRVLPPDQCSRAFRAMAHAIAREMAAPPVDAGEPASAACIEARLDRVTAFLNERGYLSRWEAAGTAPADGYLLHKHNCPYAGVSDHHPELCLMDETLVADLVGLPCQRIDSMAHNGRACTYQIAVEETAPASAVLPVWVLSQAAGV